MLLRTAKFARFLSTVVMSTPPGRKQGLTSPDVFAEADLLSECLSELPAMSAVAKGAGPRSRRVDERDTADLVVVYMSTQHGVNEQSS
jgi:hypothetical protein